MAAIALSACAHDLNAQCGRPPAIPAYAHNDYLNSRPLLGALDAGLRGVEADVFLVRDRLVVAHDRADADTARDLESLYLEPLRALVARCGSAIAGDQPFLLTIELKQRRRAAYDSLLALLGRYESILSFVLDGRVRPGPVEVVLVGWHPPLEELRRLRRRPFGVQLQITAKPDAPDTTVVVRLVSLNYDEVAGWSGEGVVDDRTARALDALARAKHAAPGRLARVYNVPARAAIYRTLLAAGVDLIGARDLAITSRLMSVVR